MRPLLFLDLDDTLYTERDYVRSGFAAVSRALARDHNIGDAEALVSEMLSVMDAQGRGHVFDHILAAYGLPHAPSDIAKLVDLYRQHRPDIALAPGYIDTLTALRHAFTLWVVTDGLPLMQQRKAGTLGLERYIDGITYCWAEGAPKPAPDSYLAARTQSGVKHAVALVGDRPDHDGIAAKALALPFVRVRRGRFADAPGASDADISDFTEVPQVLADWDLFP